LTQAFEMLQTI